MFGILHYDLFAGALSGLAAQQVLYRITEVPVIPYLEIYGLINVLLLFLLSRSSSNALHLTARALAINVTYNTVLIALTAIRRLFFHPLADFPGSRWSAVSTLHEIILLLRGRRTEYTYDQHQLHGDFIRTGPNELSINNVEAIDALYARRHQHVRGPFYAAPARGGDGINMFMYRGDPGIHGMLRRIW